ncbi:MAG: DUF58 domain-containing protein [Candidatus Nanopelagicales bacterium]
MRAALRQLTGRGRFLLVLGIVGLIVSLVLEQRDLLRFGVLLVALPLLSAALVSRTRYRLASARGLRPTRVTVDAPSTAVVRLENVSRLPSGLLLVEDAVPWQLGRSQRFVIDRLESGGRRDVRYELRSPVRGRYTVGPVSVQLVDPFGLCRATRQFATTDTLTVVPATVPLPGIPLGGDWSGLGEARARAVASAGEDDVIPREYRIGDDLRRVHWKSTAKSGELMVRREEQPWRTRATVFLDTRAVAHRGDGPAGSFEWAVSAAASIAVHLARRGYAVRILDADGTVLTPGAVTEEGFSGAEAEGPLLDTLALVTLTEGIAPGVGDARGRSRVRDGLLVAILGDLEQSHAEAVAALRSGHSSAAALVLDTSGWASRATMPEDGRTTRTAALLSAAGWRVAVCGPQTDLPDTWRHLAGSGSVAGGAR